MLLSQTYFGRSPGIINTSYCASFVPWSVRKKGARTWDWDRTSREGVEEGERTIKLIVWTNLTNQISG